MKIKIGTVKEDVTAYGNRFYIQIEDSKTCDNSDLRDMVGKEFAVIIGPLKAFDDYVQEIETL